MEYLSEDCIKLLLSKEWLVKSDNNKSIPYLMKFYSSLDDLSCFIMITDTKDAWGEVLSSKAFARRWRDCNPSHVSFFADESGEEDEWRRNILRLLSNAHTLGGMEELSFEVIQSANADLAFELGSEGFKWRWETYHLGPKVTAETLSKQLILPLISLTHLAFSTPDAVSELSETDLEKGVDKLARTGRRTIDTHVKHAISRPKTSTALRRMTAMFNFLLDLPPILSSVNSPVLAVPEDPPKLPELTSIRSQDVPSRDSPAPSRVLSKQTTPELRGVVSHAPNEPDGQDSITEPESTDEEDKPSVELGKLKGKEHSHVTESNISSRAISPKRALSARSRQPTPISVEQTRSQQEVSSSKTPDLLAEEGSTSSLRTRPAKKKRVQESSSSGEDSEAERKRRVARMKSAPSRGAKQPLKRGGRRF